MVVNSFSGNMEVMHCDRRHGDECDGISTSNQNKRFIMLDGFDLVR